MILFCNNLVCAYVHKICEDKFGCMESMYMATIVNADDSGTAFPQDDAVSRQDISTPFSILIEFEATGIFEFDSIFDLYSKF